MGFDQSTYTLICPTKCHLIHKDDPTSSYIQIANFYLMYAQFCSTEHLIIIILWIIFQFVDCSSAATFPTVSLIFFFHFFFLLHVFSSILYYIKITKFVFFFFHFHFQYNKKNKYIFSFSIEKRNVNFEFGSAMIKIQEKLRTFRMMEEWIGMPNLWHNFKFRFKMKIR